MYSIVHIHAYIWLSYPTPLLNRSCWSWLFPILSRTSPWGGVLVSCLWHNLVVMLCCLLGWLGLGLGKEGTTAGRCLYSVQCVLVLLPCLASSCCLPTYVLSPVYFSVRRRIYSTSRTTRGGHTRREAVSYLGMWGFVRSHTECSD